jgi:hypothetical protein
MHGKSRTAMVLTAKTSLPCDSPMLHGKGFAVRRRTAKVASLPCAKHVLSKKRFKLAGLGIEPRTQRRESVQSYHWVSVCLLITISRHTF